ncbi:MAG TPA: hypothetical protein VNJ46_08040, partial [Gaiellaceae bacterium]|nr:hypothetical protein [Gaiellaceae bacterium]
MARGGRRGRILLAGGATAAALALGSLLGGVLAETAPPPAADASAPSALAERALSGAPAALSAGGLA